jgi:hypothetical protein
MKASQEKQKPLSRDKGGIKTNETNRSIMVSVSFLRGSGKHRQGGRPGLSIEIDLQLRNSAGLSPASPLLSSPSGMKDTLNASYSIVAGVYLLRG